MAESAQFEVMPGSESTWLWQLRGEDGKIKDGAKDFATRGDAIAAAREARGDKLTSLFTEDGAPHSVVAERGPERLVLLRDDGSFYGEVDNQVALGGAPQYVSLEAASESSEAVS